MVAGSTMFIKRPAIFFCTTERENLFHYRCLGQCRVWLTEVNAIAIFRPNYLTIYRELSNLTCNFSLNKTTNTNNISIA